MATVHFRVDNVTPPPTGTLLCDTMTLRVVGVAGPLIKAIDHHLFWPPLTGPYKDVGYYNFTLEVPRKNPLTRALEKGSIGVQIFAPICHRTTRKLPLVVAGKLKVPSTHAFIIDGFASFNSDQRYPIVIFSHGLGFDPSEYRHLHEEIASQGVTCICLDHPYSSSSALFTKERELADSIQQKLGLTFDETATCLASMQTENILYIVEQIQTGSLREPLKKFCSLEKIITIGHSLGGAASIEAARSTRSIVASVNLDGALRGERAIAGLIIPVITLISGKSYELPDIDKDSQARLTSWTTFNKNSPQSRNRCLRGTDHMDYSVVPLLKCLDGEEVDLTSFRRTHLITMQEIMGLIRETSEDTCDCIVQ